MEEYFNRNTKKSYWLKRIKILKGEEPSEHDEAVANSIALHCPRINHPGVLLALVTKCAYIEDLSLLHPTPATAGSRFRKKEKKEGS